MIQYRFTQPDANNQTVPIYLSKNYKSDHFRKKLYTYQILTITFLQIQKYPNFIKLKTNLPQSSSTKPTFLNMSKPYFIELFEQKTNNFIGKFKFVLEGKTVKQIKDLIVQRLVNKKQVEPTDQVSIKDNDQYELGSGDDVNDVIPDGKVKMYVSKNNLNNANNQQIANLPQVLPVNNSSNGSQNSTGQNVVQSQNPVPVQLNPVTSNNDVSANTTVLDMTGFKLPVLDQNEKFILKAICPQIRKSIIQIPLSNNFQNYYEFSKYVVDLLGLSKELKAVLYNQSGSPYVNNLELSLLSFPKIDFSEIHYIVFTKTNSTCDSLPQIVMQLKTNTQSIRITKPSAIFPLDIKFDIDLSNTVAVLKYKIYELTKIHPLNQILKFGNSVLANDLQTLSAYNIKQDSIIQLNFKLNSNIIPSTLCDKFYYKDVKIVNQQNELSIQSFRSNLIVFTAHLKEQDRNKFLSVLQKYSSDLPLVYAFKSLFQNCMLSQTSKIALQEGLYTCILNFIKGLKQLPVIKTQEIFLYIRNFFGFIFESMTKITKMQQIQKHNQSVNLQNVCTFTLKNIKNPSIVKIDDGQIILVDRDSMIQQINKGFTFDQYKKPKVQDLKTNPQLQLAWSNFTNNHLDNESFTSLFWFGKKNHQNDDVVLAQQHCQIGTYLAKIDNYENLQISNPLQLKNKCHCPLLLRTKQNRLRVYVSKNKDISKPFNLFNPISGNQQAVNLDLMSGATTTQNTEAHIDLTDLKPVITRQPKQAIVVLFDISGSMGSKFFNQPDLMRIGAVKSFFEAFAYRTIAYNLEHVVSLIFFDDKIQVQCDFTEAIFDFNRLISNAQPRGSTKLYDSIVLAAQNLVIFGKKYPQCKLRILALTDGQDNTSKNSYVDAAKTLVENNITIDSFAVSTSCDGLKTITLASGGKCYLTRNLEESLKLFEQQTVLSVRVRSPQQRKPNMTIQQLIAKAQTRPFDEVNSVHKFKMPEIKASGTSGKQLAKKLQNEEQAKKFAGNNSMKRIIKQIQVYTQDPHPFVSIYPSADLNYWKILLLGPKDTPYQNGLFLLYARFPNDYPFRAPEVRFITPIYHCNMNSQGRICHSVFDRNYSPALKFKNIVECVYGLILTPQPEDPLDNVVASFYLSDYQTYLKNAKQATIKNASHTTQKLVQQLYGNIADDIERQKKIEQINNWIEQAKKNN